MRLRTGPVVSLALFLGLAGYVYHDVVRRPAGKTGTDGGERALPFERADLKAIAIRNTKGAVRLEKDGEAWRVTAPLATGADRDAVESLVTSLEGARIDRRLGEQQDLKAYGLDPATCTVGVELASAPEPRSLVVGDANPIGTTRFVLLPGGKEVAVVSAPIGDVADRDLLALRDKTLLAFEPYKVKRLTLERGRETIRLSKPDDGWKIEEPIETPADGPAISDLLSGLERLRAREFVTEQAAAADLRRYGLQPPAARVTLLQEGWDVEKSLLFGGRTGADRYARTAGRDPVVKVPDDIWDKITTRLFDLRRKDLLAVGQYRIETITASRGGAPAVVLSRDKEGGWTASGGASGAVKSETMDAVLRAIGNLRAEAFDDHPAPSRRAGLSRHPSLDLVLQEEKDAAADGAKAQHLVFGRPQAGRVAALDPAWRPLAYVPRNQLDNLLEQLDAAARDAAEPEATPSPSPAPSSSPAP